MVEKHHYLNNFVRMRLRDGLIIGHLAVSLAAPASFDWTSQTGLVRQDDAVMRSDGMRLLSLSPSEDKWVTEEEKSHLIRVCVVCIGRMNKD